MGFIELKNVTYRYPLAKHPALQDFTCSFETGKFYGIIGENGGGKTTLCNLVRGLIPHFYQGDLSGGMTINGRISGIDVDMLSTRFGYIFQNPFTQIAASRNGVRGDRHGP
jgi:energy-coupling factor transport system ATP-binding protein